jgi:GntR family transcriptional regulator/MocR family aminotransferase
MAGSRATFGVELPVDLTGRPKRAGLEHELREAVREGRLASGTRLPSSRTLAKDLGIARNSVAEAYGQLVAEGWFVTRHGAGTWVADRVGPEAAAERAGDPRPMRFDLRPGVPDLGAFPRSAWLAAARRALAVAAHNAFGYGDPRGLPVLREALAEYLVRARRVVASPERIVVVAGFAQGLELLCAVLRARGARTLAVEAHGHRLHRGIAEASGLAVRNLAVDGDGAVIAALDDTGAALLTPAHQFPLGVALAPDRRRQAVTWAAHTGAILIEDDYDGEFRYDRQTVGAMQSLAPGHVVYAGTAAKSLAPGLRLGWLVPPATLIDEVVEAKRARGAFANTLDQLTLAEFLSAGAFDRQVRRARLAYSRRRERLLATLAGRVELSGIAAGLHAVAHLPGGDEQEVVSRAAREHGLALQGLGAFTAAGHERAPALVIGYGTPPEHAYSSALARLSAVL